MTDISKRLDRLIRREQTILPVKTEQGILVGDILIVNVGTTKDIFQGDALIYANVYLNAVTIAIANILARRGSTIKTDQLWRADQEYGKWYDDSMIMRSRYQKAADSRDHERADILYARYCESRDRAIAAKDKAQALAKL